MLKYKAHKNAEFGMYNEDLDKCQDRVTYLSFDQWKTFYNADPEHWTDHVNSNYQSGKHEYVLPVYKINQSKSSKPPRWEYHYIKFLSRRDYRRYLRFTRDLRRKGEDCENMAEIISLSKVVREEGAKRVEKFQKEQEEAMASVRKFAENAAAAANAYAIPVEDTKTAETSVHHLTGDFYFDRDSGQICKIVRRGEQDRNLIVAVSTPNLPTKEIRW